MIHSRFCQFSALFIGLATLAGPPTFADYVIVDLGPPQGAFGSLANGINASGQVAGVGIIGRGGREGPPYGFSGALWQNDTVSAIGGFAAIAINDSGQVVGSTDTGPFLWQNGRLNLLGAIFAPAAISPSGQVVGSMSGGKAVLWQNGSLTVLGPGFATGINASGQIVGGTEVGPFYLGTYKYPGTANSHAFLWQNGAITDLGAGWANAINGSSQIVGSANGQAVLWQNGQKAVLGPGIAEAVNDLGQVVGSLTANPLGPGAGEPFLWQDGKRTDLNTLLPRNSGWDLIDASGINDAGQIVGTGFYHGVFQGFLLSPTQAPIPEPSGLVLLVLGATSGLFFWIRARHRRMVMPRATDP